MFKNLHKYLCDELLRDGRLWDNDNGYMIFKDNDNIRMINRLLIYPKKRLGAFNKIDVGVRFQIDCVETHAVFKCCRINLKTIMNI